MQSEEEKYYLFDQYLKGKLSEQEESVLKKSFSENEFRQETEIHRLANKAVEEHYLLGIRAATKKVIRRNSAWQTGKWVGGVCIIAAGIIGYYIYSENLINQKTPPLTSPVTVKNAVIKPIEPSKPSLKNKTTIKPNKNNQTTNFSKHETETASKKQEEQEYILQKANPQDLKQEVLIESKPAAQISNIATKVSDPLIVAHEKKVSKKELAQSLIDAKETFDLVLHTNRDELVSLPVEEGFNGELVLLDATGTSILKKQIRNGLPKDWNGINESGGMANPGQYVFILRSQEGKEVKQGYVTVVR